CHLLRPRARCRGSPRAGLHGHGRHVWPRSAGHAGRGDRLSRRRAQIDGAGRGRRIDLGPGPRHLQRELRHEADLPLAGQRAPGHGSTLAPLILSRLYLYFVGAAALVVLATGLVLLGGTILLFALNDPTAETSRGQLAIFTAMTVVALPVWGIHFWFAQRFAS